MGIAAKLGTTFLLWSLIVACGLVIHISRESKLTEGVLQWLMVGGFGSPFPYLFTLGVGVTVWIWKHDAPKVSHVRASVIVLRDTLELTISNPKKTFSKYGVLVKVMKGQQQVDMYWALGKGSHEYAAILEDNEESRRIPLATISGYSGEREAAEVRLHASDTTKYQYSEIGSTITFEALVVADPPLKRKCVVTHSLKMLRGEMLEGQQRPNPYWTEV